MAVAAVLHLPCAGVAAAGVERVEQRDAGGHDADLAADALGRVGDRRLGVERVRERLRRDVVRIAVVLVRGVVGWTGKTPVVWSRGRSFVVDHALVAARPSSSTCRPTSPLPATATFLLMSYSVLLLTNHGPRRERRPPLARHAAHVHLSLLGRVGDVLVVADGRMPSAYLLP